MGDKTPFHHNRQDPLFTPAPQSFKFVKFALEEDEPELLWPSNAAPTSNLLRPSSMRKSLRGRLSGDGDKERGGERFGPLGLKGLKLQTPMNPKNRHWDVGELDLEVPVETEPIAEEEEEDDDEIEYMPPKVGEFAVPLLGLPGLGVECMRRHRGPVSASLRLRDAGLQGTGSKVERDGAFVQIRG